MKMIKNNMENLRNNLPIFSVVLVALSLIRLIIYYSSFGVDIVSYIDLSEALILSIPFFVYGFLLQAIMMVILAVTYVLLVIFSMIIDRVKNKPYVPGHEKQEQNVEDLTLWGFVKEYYYYLFNIILLIMIFIGAFKNHSSDTMVSGLGMAAFLILASLAKKNNTRRH